MQSRHVVDFSVLRDAVVCRDPYEHMIGERFVAPEMVPAVAASFPDIRATGFHPAADMRLEGAFAALIEDLESDELSAVLSRKFGIDFVSLPRLTTIRKLSAPHEGRIHCDSECKVGSLLLYMNETWLSPEGRLRVLRSADSFDDYAAEVSPETGSVFAFLRSDYSWHGHTPFTGERRVVQVAWLRSQADVDRKTKRHRVSGLVKSLFGRGGAVSPR